jgi:hypothetical protein
VLGLFRNVERGVLWLQGALGERKYVMAERQTHSNGTSNSNGAREQPRVRTSVSDGRKYVDSNELIRTKKAQRQIKQLQRMFGSSRV